MTVSFPFANVTPEAAPAPAASTAFTPTAEQQRALELFRTGESMTIEAFAGSGKTSTLRLLAEDAQARGLHGQYVAFGKGIVTDSAASFPPNVSCRTAHSLAFGDVGVRMKHRLNGPKLRAREIASILGIQPLNVTVVDAEGQPKLKALQPSFLATHVMRALRNFCHSADEEVSSRHFPRLDGTDEANDRNVALALLPKLQQAWDDLNLTDGKLPYEHDHYLKSWALTHPRLPVDFILVDESQDLNPVLCGVVLDQTCQIVMVGDEFQSIMGFTGAVNAIKTFRETVEHRATLTTSFRFGPAIAEIANVMLGELGSPLKITGTSIPSTVQPVSNPKAILARTNAIAISQLFAAQDIGKQAHLVGGGSDVIAFAEAAQALMSGQSTQHPQLACFDSWMDVQHFVEDDEEAGAEDIKLLVKVMDDFGPEKVIQALRHQPKEAAADVVISTAHKSKGRAWDSVQLTSDFPAGQEANEKRPITDDDRKLLYVAMTRARLTLDVSLLGRFREWQPSEAPVVAAPPETTGTELPRQPEAGSAALATASTGLLEPQRVQDTTEAAPEAPRPAQSRPMVPATPCAWRKTRDGEWVVIGSPKVVRAGTVVTVARKDGSQSQERIAWTGAPFMVDGLQMVYGHVAKDGGDGGSRRSPTPSQGKDWPGKMCPACDSEPLDRNLSCWECGYRGRA